MSKTSSKILQGGFFLIGLLLFIYLVAQLGWENLLNNIIAVGWWWLPMILLALTWQLFHTMAWWQVLISLQHKFPLGQLFKLKMIAEAINMVAPTANIGGDTVRAYLIKNRIPLSAGIPGVVIDKTLDYISKMVFNIVGFSIAVFFIDVPESWFWGCVIYLTFIFIFYALLIYVQIRGFSGWILKLGQWIPPLKKGIEKRKEQFELLDQNLKSAYTTRRYRLLLAGLYHMVGRMLGVFEIWLVLSLLGAYTGFIQVFFIAAVVNVVNGIFFIVPGQWGVSEGAQLKLVELLGFTATIGLSLGVIRRIRKLALTGVGLLFLLFFKKDIDTDGLQKLEKP